MSLTWNKAIWAFFLGMCIKRNFAERLRKPTRTAQVGYAEHGSEGTYAEATRRLSRAMPTTLFAYAGAGAV